VKKKPNFIISNYALSKSGEHFVLQIEGQKLPPPSKRITLNQTNIKILSAKIVYKHKKGDIEFEVNRINFIKSFGEVRIHTNNVLYPGKYVLDIEYTGQLDKSNLSGGENLV
jgi:hypothetical protein